MVEIYYDVSLNCIKMVSVFVAIFHEDEIVIPTEHGVLAMWFDYDMARSLLPFGHQRESLRLVKEGFVDRKPHASMRVKL